MITAFIIGSSVVLAAVYSAAWFGVPGFRRRIEQPKHWFQAQVRQYDQACHGANKDEERPDAS